MSLSGRAGTISISDPANGPALTVSPNVNLEFSGTITDSAGGPGSLLKTGSRTLTLGGVNTYSGSTTVNGGSLVLANANALQNSTLTTGGIVFDQGVATHAFTLGGLSGSGNIGLKDNGSNAVALAVGNNGTSTIYSGVLSGNGSLVKTGNGTLTLTATSTYTGGTAINQGELVVNGSLGSLVTVNSGGILGGTGYLSSVTVNAGGQLAPGDSLGALNLRGSLILESGAVMDYELDTPSASSEVLMPLSQLVLSGQQFSDFHFTWSANFAPGNYDLIDFASSSGRLGTNTSGTIDGYPATLTVRNNNDLVLSVTPEPSSLALLAVGVISLAGCRLGTRRKRRLAAEPTSSSRNGAPITLSFPSQPSRWVEAKRRAA